jgi:ribosomal protein S18 acetylase RimI-like enzyme
MQIIPLKPSQKKQAARVLARAFHDYPQITFYYPDPLRRMHFLGWYLGCLVNYGLLYGEVNTTPDIAGVICWLPPGQTHYTLWRYIRSGFILTPWKMGQENYQRSEACEKYAMQMHRELVPGPHYYLWAVVVDPDHQRKGVGSCLIQPGLDRADARGLPVYLETHNEKNVAYYQRFGFRLARSAVVPGYGLPFWCMIREA